jgi:taurine dioxygenase
VKAPDGLSIQPSGSDHRGEYVLQVSPWQAAGIEGEENPAGDALLEALLGEVRATMTPYWHIWEPGDMVMWDNWRMLHSAGGTAPEHKRHMIRSTISGDYGLGAFEDGGNGPPAAAA